MLNSEELEMLTACRALIRQFMTNRIQHTSYKIEYHADSIISQYWYNEMSYELSNLIISSFAHISFLLSSMEFSPLLFTLASASPSLKVFLFHSHL